MRVSIIGLGWLGEPLADYMLKRGVKIKGSTTTVDKSVRLKKKGISAYPFFLNPLANGEGTDILFDADVLIINIPPMSRTASQRFHLEQIRELKRLIQKGNVPRVLFVSATSVYPDLNQEAKESDDLCSISGNATLLEAESLLSNNKTYDLTVIRLGGLLGDNRIPGLYVSNKEQVIGDVPVNYIYRLDAVRLIGWVIDQGLWNEVYNGVAPFHPLRQEIYEKNAAAMGFLPPLSYKEPGTTSWKKISSEKIILTGFRFEHHPLQFPYTQLPSK